jgi:hypothetical protein
VPGPDQLQGRGVRRPSRPRHHRPPMSCSVAAGERRTHANDLPSSCHGRVTGTPRTLPDTMIASPRIPRFTHFEHRYLSC